MGKPKHSNDTRGEQKGAQTHAEGQQGPKAHEAFLAGISDHSRRDAEAETDGRAAHDPRQDGTDADEHEQRIANPGLERDGGHRLFENRTQHDEAERGSERNRRDRDLSRHGHDAGEFQGHDASGTEPNGGDDGRANVRNVGKGGGNRSDEDRGES